MPDLLNNGTFVCFMAIALAGLGVLMGYAIFSRFNNNTNEDPSREQEQAQYMREVRLRYQGSMANANGYGRKWMQITQDQGGHHGGYHGGHRESEASYV